VIYLARCTVTVATCVDRIILQSLQRKVKINELAIYSSQPDAGPIEQAIYSAYRDTTDLRVKPEQAEINTARITVKTRMYEKSNIHMYIHLTR